MKYCPNNTCVCIFGLKIKYIYFKKHVRMLSFSFDFSHPLYLYKKATLDLSKS